MDYEAAAKFIERWEGYRAHAYWDVNHWRIGFGSDTKGAEQTNVRKGDITTRADALANLEKRIPRFIAVIIAQIGGIQWHKLTQDGQIALIDLVYNYGSLPHSIVWACKHGDAANIAHAILGHEHDNRSVNEDRRKHEAALVTGSAVV
jgi:GH24 family phage-related lysozyme (muramidase)